MSSPTVQILEEIKQLKKVIAQLAGTADLPESEFFSGKLMDKAVREFSTLQARRARWVPEHGLDKILRRTGWRVGEFIRTEFAFTAFIKVGRDYYYDRDVLKTFAAELKARGVDLRQYQKLREDEIQFARAYEKMKGLVRQGKTKKRFIVPAWLKDIASIPVKLPDRALVQADLDVLQQEFVAGGYHEYVDIHRQHAVMKRLYPYEKYLKPGLRLTLRRWCDSFNTANSVLKEITGKMPSFNPVPADQQIEL